MEKGQESKQKRKTPLTTIAISQEYAQKLDEYLKGTGITRKEFVELSVDYFQRTGFDLRGEAFDLSPLEKVAGRLEQSAKIMEQHNEETEAVRLLLQTVREQTAKQLPAPELMKNHMPIPKPLLLFGFFRSSRSSSCCFFLGIGCSMSGVFSTC